MSDTTRDKIEAVRRATATDQLVPFAPIVRDHLKKWGHYELARAKMNDPDVIDFMCEKFPDGAAKHLRDLAEILGIDAICHAIF